MHIAIDSRELAGRPTGVGTYLRHLLDEWAQMPAAGAHRWTMYVPEGDGQKVEGPCAFDARFQVQSVPGRAGTWWEQTSFATAVARARPDVLFAPGYTAPLRVSVPVVLTVHDVSFFAHHEWFTWRQGLRRRLVTGWSARRARSILTVSEFSKGEIVRWLRVPPDRVRVIRHGISRPGVVHSTEPADREVTAAGAPRGPMVLYVGSIFNRRHVPDLIRAFALVSRKVSDARLEIVGDNRTRPREDLDALASDLGISNRVAVRSYVSDEELAQLYSHASAFAFLSEYEGFGFTPLEALAHSVPVVVLDTGVAREVYGDAAIYAPPDDVAAVADGLARLLTDAGLRARQLQHAPAVLARYCWPETARLTLEAIEQAGGHA